MMLESFIMQTNLHLNGMKLMNILEVERDVSFPFSIDTKFATAIEMMRLKLIYFSAMDIPGY